MHRSRRLASDLGSRAPSPSVSRIPFASPFALAALLAAPAPGQSVSGTLFHDVDRDGVHDPGEPVLAGLPVTLYGENGLVDTTVASGADGSFLFTATNGAHYVVSPDAGADWRFSFQDLGADVHPIPDWPRGRRRPGPADRLLAGLRASSPAAKLVHVALGDSIGFGINLCDSWSGENDYVTPLTTAKLDLAGAASILKLATPGYLTYDLLDPATPGNIFDAINAGAGLVTISICGNDFLADDGDGPTTAANLVAARQNLQEMLSALASELPDADVVVNTIYDNEGGANPFHVTWAPSWNQMVRDVCWGQRRRVAVAEIFPDYEHLDAVSGALRGEANLICDFFGLDTIHPKKRGYDLHEEKVWQGIGGVTADADGEAVEFGFVQRIATLLPTAYADLGGGASQEGDAFAQDDTGALIPAGAQELRLSGFDATPRGILSQVVAKVRYRVNGPLVDDTYRFEASVDGTFSAPGSTATTWNTIVPIVGSAGGSIPVLAVPDPGNWREVSALVTKGAAGDGSPTLTWGDLATLTIRLIGTANGAPDGVDVEWDVAALEVYGVAPDTLLVRGAPEIGTTVQIDTTGVQGADAWLWLAGAPGSLPFPPFGTFGIDLSASVLLDRTPIGADGTRTLFADVPDDPTIVGIPVWLQSLVVESYKPKAGALTNVVELTIQ